MFIAFIGEILPLVQLVVEEVLPNPPPDQPEWVSASHRSASQSRPQEGPSSLSFPLLFQIKALISAPTTETAPPETKKPEEPATAPAAEPPTVAPRPKPAKHASGAQALGLLAKRTFEKCVLVLPFFSSKRSHSPHLFCFQASARQVDRDHFVYRGKNVHQSHGFWTAGFHPAVF